MPIITLRFKDIKIKDYPIAIGQTCTIGRKHSNDIVIDNLAVSGSHARIEGVSTTFILRDLDSTNGTFVNDEKITMHNLRHEDVIKIGKHELFFDLSDLVKATPNVRDSYDVDKTRILDTGTYRDQANKPANFIPSKAEERPSFFARLMKMIFG